MARKSFIEIPLKTTGYTGPLPAYMEKTLQGEYAHQYLENIGTMPSSKNVEFVHSNLPLSESLILPVWSREIIAIVPGMTLKQAESTSIIQDIFQ